MLRLYQFDAHWWRKRHIVHTASLWLNILNTLREQLTKAHIIIRIIITCATSFIIYHLTFALFILFRLFFSFSSRLAKVGIMLNARTFLRFTNYYSTLVAKRMECMRVSECVLKHTKRHSNGDWLGPDKNYMYTPKMGMCSSYSYWWVANEHFSMKFASENGEIMLYRYISFERMNNMPHNGNRFQITWCPKNRKRRRQCDDKRIDIEVKSGEKKNWKFSRKRSNSKWLWVHCNLCVEIKF